MLLSLGTLQGGEGIVCSNQWDELLIVMRLAEDVVGKKTASLLGFQIHLRKQSQQPSLGQIEHEANELEEEVERR